MQGTALGLNQRDDLHYHVVLFKEETTCGFLNFAKYTFIIWSESQTNETTESWILQGTSRGHVVQSPAQ